MKGWRRRLPFGLAVVGLLCRQWQTHHQLSLPHPIRNVPSWGDTFHEGRAASMNEETAIVHHRTTRSDESPWGNQTEDATCVESPASPLTWTNYSRRSRVLADMMQEVVLAPHTHNTASPLPSPLTTLAVCRFRQELPFAGHFPHAMQQLYRCVSWWRHQQQQPLPQGYDAVHAVLLWEDKILPPPNPFLRGFLRLLHESSLHVTTVANVPTANRTTLVRVAQVRLDDGGLYDYRLHTPADATALREAASSILPMDDDVCPSAPRITILNRRKKRRILNVGALQARLSMPPQPPPPTVRYFENSTFREQVSVMARTDILVSPHGAQLVSLPFLPPCAVILEVLPTGYYAPEFFGTLAAAAGRRHAYLYLGTNRTAEVAAASATPRSRATARRRSLCVPVTRLHEAVEAARVVWQQCCKEGY
jgi:hypothetical protein